MVPALQRELGQNLTCGSDWAMIEKGMRSRGDHLVADLVFKRPDFRTKAGFSGIA